MTDKPTKEQLLAELAATYQQRQQRQQEFDRQQKELFEQETALVAALREADTTWQVIADTIGRQKSNTITTYRPHLEETSTRTVRVKPPAA